jgi:hypothetical protein
MVSLLGMRLQPAADTVRSLTLGCALLTLCTTACQAAGPERPVSDAIDVDLKLILAVDVSTSMSEAEQRTQRDGYVSAFHHPALAAAIESGALGRVAVLYLEWAGPRHRSVIVPWTVLDDSDDASAMADLLAAQPLTQAPGTSISSSLIVAGEQFALGSVRSPREVIDISADGGNNSGPPLAPVRESLLARGITINGLPIALGDDRRTLSSSPDSGYSSYSAGYLQSYFEHCVIGGPGAFLIGVTEADLFKAAILRKLVLEVAERPAPVIPASHSLSSGQFFDCSSVGEVPGR